MMMFLVISFHSSTAARLAAQQKVLPLHKQLMWIFFHPLSRLHSPQLPHICLVDTAYEFQEVKQLNHIQIDVSRVENIQW